MEKEKRYTVILDAYVYAENENEARLEAEKAAELLRTLDDNHANVLSLTETQNGLLSNQKEEITKEYLIKKGYIDNKDILGVSNWKIEETLYSIKQIKKSFFVMYANFCLKEIKTVIDLQETRKFFS